MEWERAAQVLDLSPEMLRRIRFPRFECTARHENSCGGFGLLHIAAGALSSGEGIACVAAGGNVTGGGVTAECQELQLSAVLAGIHGSCAALGLHIAEGVTGESELWQLAQESAPVIARNLGEVRVLPRDLASAAVAGWIAHAAAQLGYKIRIPWISPEEYCSQLDRLRARTMLHFAALALQESGNLLRQCSASVVGTGLLACECLRALREVGAQVTAAADESGSVIDATGIDVPSVLRHVETGGLLAELKGCKHGLHSDAISAGADLLLLCTSATEITQNNAGNVKAATVVIDGGHPCLSGGAAQILAQREIVVVPTKVVRCPELVAEFPPYDGKQFAESNDEQVRMYISNLWERIRQVRKTRGLTLPDAVMVLALGRLAELERNARP